MTQEEIEEIKDIMESCPWCEHPPGDGAVCAMYFGTFVPCDGACGYVADYIALKELELRKNNYEKNKDKHKTPG